MLQPPSRSGFVGNFVSCNDILFAFKTRLLLNGSPALKSLGLILKLLSLELIKQVTAACYCHQLCLPAHILMKNIVGRIFWVQAGNDILLDPTLDAPRPGSGGV